MDRVIVKKYWNKKRILTIAGITGLVALIAASYFYTSGGSKLNVETDRITVSEVTKGPFQETIPVNVSPRKQDRHPTYNRDHGLYGLTRSARRLWH